MTVDTTTDLQLAAVREPVAFEAIEARLDAIAQHGSATPTAAAAELLVLGSEVMSLWVLARGEVPTQDTKEGFHLLALQRQGSKGEPSFNACRETCRELIFHYNQIVAEPDHADTRKRLTLAAMLAKHLCLFVEGKMQVEGLGEFCCAAKPMRAGGG
jgi:hypothetical protein